MLGDSTARTRQAGFTLIELMVGMLVGFIVLSAVIYALISSIRSSSDLLNMTRLDVEMSSLGDVLVGELRRTGYVAGAANDTNPFYLEATKDLVVDSSSCVLYSYDANGNGSIDNDEFKGFAFVSGAIWFRTQSTSASYESCTLNNDWKALTDSDFMTISSFSVVSSAECVTSVSGATCSAGTSGKAVRVRALEISVAASVARDTEIWSQFSETVRLPNNLVFE